MRTVETNVEKLPHSTSGAGNIHLTIFTPTREVDLDQWDLQRCFVSWRVHLLSPQNLSTLTSIRTLSLEAGNHTFYGNGPSPSLRKLDGLLDLAAKLPNLSALKCKIGADEWYSRSLASEALRYVTQDWAGPRRDSRHDFSKAIDVTALPSLRHAHLDFLHPLHVVEGIDQRITLPNLSFPAAYDPFSTSLRQLSQNLRTMHLRVVADPTLFWPIDGDNLPFWPNLEHIHVEFHMSNPAGSWYFKGPQGLLIQDEAQSYTVSTDQLYPPLSDTEKDVEVCEEIGDVLLDHEYNPIKYRVEPNEDTIIPFLTAFAKAASQMPSLRDFALWSPLGFTFRPDDELPALDFSRISSISPEQLYYAKLAWGIAYTKPHENTFATCPGVAECASRQMWWRTGRWRPDVETHRLFQSIGRKSMGMSWQNILLTTVFANDSISRDSNIGSRSCD